jgi:hypothetical protein
MTSKSASFSPFISRLSAAFAVDDSFWVAFFETQAFPSFRAA